MTDAETLTADRLLGGRVVVRQPAQGYRVNADTILLAAAVEPGDRLMEAGCGVGAALLCAAARLPEATFVGVERDPVYAALARDNTAHEPRISVLQGDALTCEAGVFDGVFCNPPYDDPAQGRPPAPSRQAAKSAEVSLDVWIGALANRLRGGAALTMIHRAAALPAILKAVDGRLGGAEVLPIRPFAGAAARRVLVRARKGSRAPFALLAGLALHQDDGAFTDAAQAVFTDAAALPWR